MGNQFKKGVAPWNKGTKGLMNPWHKGRKNVYSKETLIKMSIAKGGTGEIKHTLICPVCNKSFEVPHYNFNHGAKFCSISCSKKNTHFNVGVKLSEEHKKKMSLARIGRKFPNQSGDKHPSWKGGTTTCNGYIRRTCPAHPFCDRDGYVLEHRLVAEKVIGRFLNRKEIIHHINNNPVDNRPENLYLFISNGGHSAYHNSKNKVIITKSNLLNFVAEATIPSPTV